MSLNKYVNSYGKECYSGVKQDTKFDDLEFHIVEPSFEDDIQHAVHTNLGSFTVLDRLTGFGWRDIETGYRDMDGGFWLASGGFDVRESGAETMLDAIKWVKDYANNCTGD